MNVLAPQAVESMDLIQECGDLLYLIDDDKRRLVGTDLVSKRLWCGGETAIQPQVEQVEPQRVWV